MGSCAQFDRAVSTRACPVVSPLAPIPSVGCTTVGSATLATSPEQAQAHGEEGDAQLNTLTGMTMLRSRQAPTLPRTLACLRPAHSRPVTE